MPLSAQYHGVSEEAESLTNLMPVGKHMPRSIPIGVIVRIEIRIFSVREEVMKFAEIMGRMNRIAIIAIIIIKG